MIVSTLRSDLGRYIFGTAALAQGIITLIWHDYNGWHVPYLIDLAAVAQILGGAAIQFRPSAKAGAILLAAVYLVFALCYVPRIAGAPQVYDHWGNFFEQFSLATGAAIVYARLSATWTPQTLARIARILVGLCTASFALEQAFYLDGTASLVPKWVPPNQTFWAVATTVAFALAALALLANLQALLATRLLTAMIALFGLIVWIPLLIAAPHTHTNWSETAETFAIAGVTWILANLLTQQNPPSRT
jgi:hypothetical protein